MNKPLTKTELALLGDLIISTGLSYRALGAMLDVDEQTLSRWCSGERRPNHPAMLRKALQMIILEQRGVVTAKLIEQ